VAAVIVVIAIIAAVGIALAVFGGPLVLAIVPLVIGAAVLAVLEVYRRRETAQSMSQFRREADSGGTDFTARDRETQA
jgi:membrane protein implicated in regulation of membrane protease activity